MTAIRESKRRGKQQNSIKTPSITYYQSSISNLFFENNQSKSQNSFG